MKETAKRLRAEMEAEQKQKLAQINQDFERQAAAFDTTSDTKVDEVAARIAGLLLEGGPAGEAADPGDAGMIVKMSRLRILGPRDSLPDVIKTLQDIGLLHLGNPPQSKALTPFKLDSRQERHRRYLRRAIQEVEYCLEEFRLGQDQTHVQHQECTTSDYAHWVHLARGVSREVGRLKSSAAELEEEQALILKYRSFLSGFETVLNSDIKWTTAAVYNVMLHGEGADPVGKVRESLTEALGGRFELRSHTLPSGETALLIFAPASAAAEVDRVLAEARVEDIPVPASFGAESLAPVAPRMLRRLDEIPFELEEVAASLAELTYSYGPELLRARAGIHDRLEELEAHPLSSVTQRAFVVEGWLPVAMRPEFDRRLHDEFGDALMVSEVAREEWKDEDVPVVLHNARVFRPFESIISLLPLPRYGTIDPTPFVAIFFPLFFGIMLGDVGYGIIFAAISYLMIRKSKPDSAFRRIALVGMTCAAVSIIFGILFGELFGDLGHRLFDMPILLINRETALQSMLIIAIVDRFRAHLAGAGPWRARRVSPPSQAGDRPWRHRGVCGPRPRSTVVDAGHDPEGGVHAGRHRARRVRRGDDRGGRLHGLDRIAVHAGQHVVLRPSHGHRHRLGHAGGRGQRHEQAGPLPVLGILVAFAFHAINFVLGLFAPTIHSLRLHYVEFFGKFYSGGGKRYQAFCPLGLE